VDGASLRLTEALRLRVKDLDFAYGQILVRDGKGQKDRRTVLPKQTTQSPQRHLRTVKILHEDDCSDGYGTVYLPDALARKYPNAARAWIWQYVFPSRNRSVDPRSGAERRHHPVGLRRAARRGHEEPTRSSRRIA